MSIKKTALLMISIFALAGLSDLIAMRGDQARRRRRTSVVKGQGQGQSMAQQQSQGEYEEAPMVRYRPTATEGVAGLKMRIAAIVNDVRLSFEQKVLQLKRFLSAPVATVSVMEEVEEEDAE